MQLTPILFTSAERPQSITASVLSSRPHHPHYLWPCQLFLLLNSFAVCPLVIRVLGSIYTAEVDPNLRSRIRGVFMELYE